MSKWTCHSEIELNFKPFSKDMSECICCDRPGVNFGYKEPDRAETSQELHTYSKI